MRSFRDEILKERNTFSYRMLSRLTGPDRDQDQESTSVRDTFTFTMNVCEVKLLIYKGMVCPTEKSNRKFFLENSTKRSITTERSIITEKSIITEESVTTEESVITETSIII